MEKIRKLKYTFSCNKFLHTGYNAVRSSLNIAKRKTTLSNQGIGSLKKDISGENNIIAIREGVVFNHLMLRIRGNNNHVCIEENCRFGPGCSIWLEGNHCKINIGRCSTFTHTVHLCAQEDGSEITIGEDCMFSNTITVRTSDSHPIYERLSKRRLNPPANVTVGNHVWIASNSKVYKGVQIGDGSIIGSDTLVTHDIPENSLAVGHPAKVVRESIEWTREKLF